jgi:hypothetical protein
MQRDAERVVELPNGARDDDRTAGGVSLVDPTVTPWLRAKSATFSISAGSAP